MRTITTRSAIAAKVGGAMAALLPASVRAQGCEPIRFTVPVKLGGEGEAYQPSRAWRATLAYRRLMSNQWFIGTEQNDKWAPGGSSSVFEIHAAIVDLSYAFSDRIRARVSVPLSRSSFSRTWGDGKQHEQTSR